MMEINSQRTKDLNELKKQALAYFTRNKDVPLKIEEALNSLFYDSPHDVYGYLVNIIFIRDFL